MNLQKQIDDPDHDRHIDATDQLSYLDRDSDKKTLTKMEMVTSTRLIMNMGEYDE